MAVDKIGRFYVPSDVGVQIFGLTGRPCSVLTRPDKDQPLTTCILAGADHTTHDIEHGTKIDCCKLLVEKPKP